MTVPELNEILAREFHRTPRGDQGIYAWEWSEDLFWPAYATGGQVEKTTPSGIVYFEKEYRRDRMSHKLRDQWVVTKWCAPETLTRWQSQFPGAAYPAEGYRINTDWYNPQGVAPSEKDTTCLIWAIRKQSDLSVGQLREAMEAEHDRGEKSRDSALGDEIRESFPAFLNPKPGARNAHVSMPYTETERKESLPHG